MKSHCYFIVVAVALYGCASSEPNNTGVENLNGARGEEGVAYSAYTSAVVSSSRFSRESQQLLSAQSGAVSQVWPSHNSVAPAKDINFYARGLMQDLVANLQYVNTSTPLAVASFVLLDGDYSETNLLGDQISESMIHEIHKFGIPVIDYKTRDKISVTSQGDFIFSRESKNLKSDLPIHYVVSGTLVKYQGGYLVNARVVGVASKAVVASAQSIIPADVASALLNSANKQKYKTGKSVAIVQG